MTTLERQIQTALSSLIGLKLCLTKTTGNLRGFHFGEIRKVGHALMGDYALHISCPWRIEDGARILTGSGDYYHRADDNEDPTWEYGMVWGTYQEQVLRSLLGGVDTETDTLTNVSDLLVVEEVRVSAFGDVAISLSGGYRLLLFPSGARGEEWRLLPPGDAPHFVVEAGEAYGGGS